MNIRLADRPTVIVGSFVAVPREAESGFDFDPEAAAANERVLELEVHDESSPQIFLTYRIMFDDLAGQGWLNCTGALTFVVSNDDSNSEEDDLNLEEILDPIVNLVTPTIVNLVQTAIYASNATPSGAWPSAVRIGRSTTEGAPGR